MTAATIDTLQIIELSIRHTRPGLATGKASPLLAETDQQRAMLVHLPGVLDLRLEGNEAPGESGVRWSVSRAAHTRWSR
ncbi:hypothetical protein ACFRJ8_04870 [Arthrobacter sp. NPDC056886]|uniref:hypothetical protein n=1 Tax=Arthrobacter sp. NPDC056886 TaxID=3345960 RepID=UPI003672A79C